MGARGPQPKPTAIKKAAGNPGRRQLNEHEPLPPEGTVSPPAWLTPKALEIWRAAAPVVIAMRTLTTADVLPFARYCTAFARWLELTQWLEKNGTTYTLKDAKGKPKYAAEFPLGATKMGEREFKCWVWSLASRVNETSHRQARVASSFPCL